MKSTPILPLHGDLHAIWTARAPAPISTSAEAKFRSYFTPPHWNLQCSLTWNVSNIYLITRSCCLIKTAIVRAL